MNVHTETDAQLKHWMQNASFWGGGFLKTLMEAAYRADDENYAMLRPVLLQMQAKYPEYQMSESPWRSLLQKAADGWFD